jgi:AraC-like DNA-binding protein
MTLTDLDLVARGGALALLLLLGAVLLRDQRAAIPARMGVALIAAIACNLIAEGYGLQRFPQPVAIALILGEGAISGFFWLFVRSWFDDEAHFGWFSWSVVGAIAGVSLANYLLWSPTAGGYWPTDLVMHASWITLPVLALWIAWRGRDDDMVEARRRLRIGFVWATGGALLLINLIHVTKNVLAPGQRAPLVHISTALLTLSVVAGLCYILLHMRRADIFLGAAAPTSAAAADQDPAAKALVARLQAHMRAQRCHRDDTLTIAALALQLGVTEYRLRRTINGELGFRNFAAFLNSYRLSEVKAALSDPAQRSVPILTIALDAGFGSLASFNRAFRVSEGLTPSAFRTASQAKPAADQLFLS